MPYHVVQRPSSGDCPLLIHVNSQAEVCKLNSAPRSNQNVLRLYVTVNDSPLVDVGKSIQEWKDDTLSCPPLTEFATSTLDLLKKITITGQLLHHVDISIILKSRVQLDYVGMLQFHVDPDLALNLGPDIGQ